MAPSNDPSMVASRVKQLEMERDSLQHDLAERVKELQCLYKLGTIIELQEDLEEIFQSFVNYIPPAWQFPEITCALIRYQEQEFKTPNFRETQWKLSAPFVAGGDTVGAVEVYYLEPRPDASEGPFLKEERNLLDYIAERLGKVTERAWAQEALQVTYEERENYEKMAKQRLDGLLDDREQECR